MVQSEQRLASASEHWRARPTSSSCPLTRRSTRDEEIRGDTGGHYRFAENFRKEIDNADGDRWWCVRVELSGEGAIQRALGVAYRDMPFLDV